MHRVAVTPETIIVRRFGEVVVLRRDEIQRIAVSRGVARPPYLVAVGLDGRRTGPFIKPLVFRHAIRAFRSNGWTVVERPDS